MNKHGVQLPPLRTLVHARSGRFIVSFATRDAVALVLANDDG